MFVASPLRFHFQFVMGGARMPDLVNLLTVIVLFLLTRAMILSQDKK